MTMEQKKIIAVLKQQQNRPNLEITANVPCFEISFIRTSSGFYENE